MDEEDYLIPTKLDAPALFFMWEADSAFLVIFWLIVGGLMMPLMGVFLAIVFGKGYSYLKEEGGRGLVMKLLYWYTPSDIWLSKHAASNVREYIGG